MVMVNGFTTKARLTLFKITKSASTLLRSLQASNALISRKRHKHALFTAPNSSHVIAFVSLLFLSACGGDDNSNHNNQEPVNPPPAVQPTTTVNNAAQIIVTLQQPQISNGILTVPFTVTDHQNTAFVGINSVRFTVAKLIPGNNGDVNYWQSYINRVKDERATYPNSTQAVQATNEGDGTLIDNQDGSYQYTFANDVLNATNPLTGKAIPWEENLTHRIAIEVRQSDNNPAQNAHIDFVPSGSEVSQTRNIVAIESCNQCHTQLAFHGGNRIDTAYCVTCHNPGSSEPISGESLDFKAMIHKIHRGANLPGIKAQGDGAKYSIFGFRNTEHVYATNTNGQVSGVHFPQDIRNCTNCHSGPSDTIEHSSQTNTSPSQITTNGDNWKSFPTIEACASCHDNSAFNDNMLAANPNMTKHQAAFPATNADCATCHAPGQSQEISQFHTQALKSKKIAGQMISFNSKAISLGSGILPSVDVTIEITKEGMPVSDLDQITPYLWSSAYVLVNWDDGTGYQAAYDPFGNIAQTDNQINLQDCTASDIAGEFVCNWPTQTLNGGQNLNLGTLAVTFADISVCVSSNDFILTTCPITGTGVEREPAHVTKQFYNLSNLSLINDYNEKVGANLQSCNSCHNELTVHMAATNTHAATDFAQCTSCHNANRISYYTGRPADLKFQVHKLHANNAFADGGHGAHYPSPINECAQCHSQQQINLPLQQNNRASLSTTTNIFGDKVYTSPTAVVCTSCHIRVSPGLLSPTGQVITNNGDPALDNDGTPFTLSDDENDTLIHMILVGNATFGAATASEAENSETCANCHAIGMEAGVDVVHK